MSVPFTFIGLLSLPLFDLSTAGCAQFGGGAAAALLSTQQDNRLLAGRKWVEILRGQIMFVAD